MKTLLVLRHAKSSWKDEGLDDHERPLNKRGRRDAPRMGELLAEEGLLPDLILSSTAVRALTTAEAVSEASGFAGPLVVRQELYLATPADHLEVLAAQDDQYQSVMIVAHNPGLEDLLQHLTGAAAHMPTAALAVIEIPIDSWTELNAETTGQLRRFYLPKDL